MVERERADESREGGKVVGRRGEDNAPIRNAPSCPLLARENTVFRNPARRIMLCNNPDWNLSNVAGP